MMVEYPWQNLNPKAVVQITQPHWISDIDQQVLLHLYQPILGAYAYSLYQTMLSNVSHATFVSKPIRHFEIMEQMVVGKEQYIQSRRKLEAIGLLQVFMQENNNTENEVSTIYELQAPLDSKHLFADPIMSSLLMDRLGQQRYEQLLDKFSINLPVDTRSEEWIDVTATFQDVYRLPSQYYPLSDEAEDKLIHQNNQQSTAILDAGTLNLDTLKELLQTAFVSEKALTDEVVQMCITLNKIYGYDEVDLQKLALTSTDVKTNTIDVKKMQRLAIEQASQGSLESSRVLAERTAEKQEVESKTQVQATNKWLEAGLNQDELSFAELAKEYPPVAFASSIKQQKKGYLTKGEATILNDLVNHQVLTPAVLNILVHYILVELDENRINRNYIETIADDWRQQGISEAESAMAYLKKRKTDSQKKYEQSRKRRSNKGRYQTQKDTVKPKWLDPESRQEKYQNRTKQQSGNEEQTSKPTASSEEGKQAIDPQQEDEIRNLIQSLNQKEGE